MSHPQQLQFVKSVSRTLGRDIATLKVLEIGSYDVNGSIRQFFPGTHYVGVDLTEGPGVDIVCSGDAVDHPDETYDLAISCECFEHNPNWVQTLQNMHRMARTGGVVLVTCATTGRPEHGTMRTSPSDSPGTQSVDWDYYRNLTQEDFEQGLDLGRLFSSHFFLINPLSFDLYFYGVKAGGPALFPVATSQMQAVCARDQAALLARKKREKLVPKPLRPAFRKISESPLIDPAYANLV